MMKSSILRLLATAFVLAASPLAEASSIRPNALASEFALADGIFRGSVLANVSYRDPENARIYTRTIVRVDEAFKGRFPAVIALVHRGGTLDEIGQMDGLTPRFRPGEERLLFVKRRRNGTLFAVFGNPSALRLTRNQTGAFAMAEGQVIAQLRSGSLSPATPQPDLTDQAATQADLAFSEAPSGDVGGETVNGLLVDAHGVPSRFCACDRGEAIPYLVDAAVLPTGISLNQALAAVNNAFAAWSAVTSLKFSFAGLQAFGTAAPNIQARDGIVRVQLHDTYGFISNPEVLGVGGTYFATPLLTNAGWGTGGRVAGTEFNQALCGYVVIAHTNPVLSTLSTLSEVLCHEIGHVIGLGHSSEVFNETNQLLAQAMMYYRAQENGRGATLGAYDPPVANRVNPQLSPPPFTFNRVIDVVTSSGSLTGSGINQIDLRGYGLSGDPLSLAVTNRTAKYGAFQQNDSLLKYVPSSAYSDQARLDPAGLNYYDILFARYYQALNASPYVMVRVISYSLDSFPSTASDGIPDNWMVAHFGAGYANPALGSKHKASDDYDGDGLTNLQEYRAGTDPVKASSAQRMTLTAPYQLEWQAKPYELYELQGTTNFIDWYRVGSPVLPTTATGSVRIPLEQNLPFEFLRILKVP